MRDATAAQRQAPHPVRCALRWRRRRISPSEGRPRRRRPLAQWLAACLLLPLLGTTALATQRPADLETNASYPRAAVELTLAAEKHRGLADACIVQLETLKDGPECMQFFNGMLVFRSIRDHAFAEINEACPAESACRASNATLFGYLIDLLAEVKAKEQQIMLIALRYRYGQ